MAQSGYKDVTVTSWDTLRFRWWINSQSVTSNSTTIGWVMELIATGSGRISATSTQAWKVVVNGTTYSGSSNVGIANNTTKTLASGTTTIPHNSDGSKTFSYSFEQYFGITFSGVWIATKSGSGSGTLDSIARTSVPTVSASSIDMGGTITIYTNRASTDLIHDLAYSFAGGSWVDIAKGVAASYTWATPDLSTSIPNAASGTLTIRSTSRKDGVAIGSATVTVTLKVPTSVVPTISSVAVTDATAGIAAQFGAYVQDQSALKIAITAAGAKGSTISRYHTTVAGFAHTGQSFTTYQLKTSGDMNVVVTVTDSRGRTASKTVAIRVLPYTAPATTEFRAYRSDENGYAKDDGTRLSVSYAYSVASVGGKNTASMAIAYKRQDSDTWTNLATGSDLEGSGIRFFYNGPTFSTDYQYDIRMTVTDWFGASTTYTVTLSTADVVMDISDSGKGLGFGKVSQIEGAIEFNRKLYDEFDTRIGNGLAVYTGSGSTAIDPDTTLEALVLTDKNTPGTGFWYVTTNFYSTKSDTANRMQYAFPYTEGGVMYSRVYYNGAWTGWKDIPVITDEYDQGMWHIRIWSDDRVEITGTQEIKNLECSTALGSWYRTIAFRASDFSPALVDPIVSANYESAGYGALLWATTESTSTQTPTYYLIRPTQSNIVTGRIRYRITGKLA